ncbi:TAXI family TRAP transporter solute-binding subunit [Kribbella deserti]|uniref:TAXI family TRAP transporter solute-binding subunit n=1 Tax=Kribbella deserti TaxID=1926257 RepID=A0ABV6QKH0_9ACTN
MDRRSFLGAAVAGAAAVVTPGCSRGRSDEPAPSFPAKLATGNAGGVYDKYGEGLAKLVSEVTGKELQTKRTDGSVENLRMLAQNDGADLAFSLADSAADAHEGRHVFSRSGAIPMWALARTHDNYVHVVVPLSSKIENLGDLRNKVVNVGAENSGTLVTATRLLHVSGIRNFKPRNLELGPAAIALEQGKIDALIWSGGLPTEPLVKLQSRIGFRLIDIGPQAAKLANKRLGSYVLTSVPPSVYGLSNSVNTLSVPNFLLAKFTLSDSWAWWTVNTLFRRQPELMKYHAEAGSLDQRSAIATMPVPLHPAAERWYRANHT